mgnify:CR=1 FL=1
MRNQSLRLPLVALLWWLVDLLTAPLQRLARDVGRRDATALSPLPEAELPDEVRPLVAALNALLARLDALGPQDVIDLSVGGATDLAGLQRLQAALARAEAQARHLQADLGALRLQPTDEDLAALQADGYLGEVLAELRQTLAAPGLDEAARETAQDALALLAAELLARPAAGASAGEGR